MGATLSETPRDLSAEQLLRELELRREEVQAVRDVVRLLAPNVQDTALLFSVTTILRSSFGVQRVAYLHTFTRTGEVKLAYFHNFPSISQAAIQEATRYTTTSVPEPGSLLEQMGVEFVLPLGRFVGNSTRQRVVEPKAWWLVGDFAETEEERASDLLYLEIIGMIITVYLENASFQAKQRQAESLMQEIALASRIQSRILASADLAPHPRLEIENFHRSHSEIGGDLYDFICVDSQRVLFYVGDVSGKGISAALVMSNLQGQIRTLAELRVPLPKLMAQLHRRLLQLYGENESGFVTLFLGLMDLSAPHTATLTYLNAGHPPPILLRQGKVILLPANLSLLGIDIPGLTPVEGVDPIQLALEPGDHLMAYTDGLIEQTNPRGEILGVEKLQELLTGYVPPSARAFLSYVRQLLEDHRKGRAQAAADSLKPHSMEDDTTIITCKLLS